MKKLNFLSLLFIAITIVSCRNTTTKNTTTNVVPSNEEIQKAGETNNEMLRLTTMELTDKKGRGRLSRYSHTGGNLHPH